MITPDWDDIEEFPEPEIPVAGLTPLPDMPIVLLPDDTGDALEGTAPSPSPTDTPEPLPERVNDNYMDIADGIGRHEGEASFSDREPIHLAGKLDCYLARVVKTYYGSGKKQPTIGVVQGIDAERIEPRWTAANNDPIVGTKPSPRMGTPGVVSAVPFPLRADQARYHVEVDDIVTILQSGDGTAVFISDDLPFVGVVVAWDDDDVTEEYNGGTADDAATLTLKVRQQIMSGDPFSDAVTLADREAAHDAWVTNTAYVIDDCRVYDSTTYRCKEGHTSGTFTADLSAGKWEADNVVVYRYVNVIQADNMNHGYRVGDKVLVVRRGSYLFCLPQRGTFLALTNTGASSGPESEADFSDEHYWVKEVDPLANYSDNAWTFDSPMSVRSATDPTGSGGRLGRHVDAVNLAERAGATHLLGDDVLVEVTMWADVYGCPYYTFTHPIPASAILDYKVKVSSNDTTANYLGQKIATSDSWLGHADINDGGDEDVDLTHNDPVTGTAYAPIDNAGLPTLCSPISVSDDRGHLLGWYGLSGGSYSVWYSPWGYSAPSLPLNGTRP